MRRRRSLSEKSLSLRLTAIPITSGAGAGRTTAMIEDIVSDRSKAPKQQAKKEVKDGLSARRTMLEVCDCNALCPCWIGEDADNGTCDAMVAWHVDKGTADGMDISDLTLAVMVFIPVNILQVNWKVVL